MIPFIVMTSDRYVRSLTPYMYLFNKYWGDDQEVTVVCFKRPSGYVPPNFHIHSLGSMDNYPVERWSNSILDFLADRAEIEHFILMLEDYWISQPVDRVAVSLLYEYMRQHPQILKIDLCADRQFARGATDYGALGHLNLVKSDYTSQYHMSLMTGIWNRRQFTRFVVPNETPWQVELDGTSRVAAAGDDVLVIGTKQWPVKHILAHRSGDASKILLDGLAAEDVEQMSELGFFSPEKVSE